MKKYVLGFAFNNDKTKLILIEKQKPEWQKGKLNGVGGKVEPSDESITHAMTREFFEETGVFTNVWQWSYFGEMIFHNDIMGGGAIVYLFRMFSDDIENCTTCEDEEIIHLDLSRNSNRELIKNLAVLIPMAKDPDFVSVTLNLS